MGSLRNPGQFFSGRLLWVLLVVCLIAVTLNELVLEPTNVHLEVFSIVDLSLFRHEEHDPYPWGSLEEHTYTPDGLLVVNPNGPHPIFELMRTAEKEWNTKLQRASRTLDEAVAEYKRRYMRDPPLGFDKWWVAYTHILSRLTFFEQVGLRRQEQCTAPRRVRRDIP